MDQDKKKAESGSEVHEIVMCMGSACYTRGNNSSVEIVGDYLERNGLKASVSFRGCLCTNRCKAAPVIIIDQKTFERVAPQSVIEILDHVFKGGEGKDEPA